MHFSALMILIAMLSGMAPAGSDGASPAQGITDRIVSEHLRLRIPVERESMGRDVIVDLERFYKFINAAAGDRMARRILVDIVWDNPDCRAEWQSARLEIGMNTPAADANPRAYLIYCASRQMVRLALQSLAKGGVVREDSEFLFDGMSEIMTREYSRSSRSLTGAWVLAQLLDRMNLLGLSVQASWSTFSRGKHDMRAAAPGITFLLHCRANYGRERVIKLFENLNRGTLDESLAVVFKTSAREIEAAWLKEVRAYPSGEDITATSDEDAPRLERTALSPPLPKPGTTLEVRLYIRTGSNELQPEGLYLEDDATGKIFPARMSGDLGSRYATVMVPIEPGRQPGSYRYRVVALDEGGNLRNWAGTYPVGK
jgi:hypothetical protein